MISHDMLGKYVNKNWTYDNCYHGFVKYMKKRFALNCRAGYFNKAQPKFSHVLNPLQFHDKFECWVLRILLSNMERF